MGIPGTALPACSHPQGPSVCLSFQSSGLGSAQKAPPSALDPAEQSPLQRQKRTRPSGPGGRGRRTTQSGAGLSSLRRCWAWKASPGWPAGDNVSGAPGV